MPVSDLSRVLFERAPCAAFLLDREGKVLDLNKEASKSLALDADRTVGMPILATVVEADRARVKELFARVLEGQEGEWTARFRRGDGVTRVQKVRAVPVSVDGDVSRIMVFSQDVTESRSGRPETLQLQTLLENQPGQLVFVVDTGGRIRYSSGLSRTHFRDDIDAVGLKFEELLESEREDRPLAREMLEVVWDGGDWGGTLWHRRIDGTCFPVRTFASPYVDPRNGRTLGALVCGRDVWKESDWRQRAESAERLAGIGGFVASIAREFVEGMSEVDQRLIGLVRGEPRAGPQLRRTVDRVASFASSIQEFAEDISLTRQHISPAEPVVEAIEAISVRAMESGVELVVEAPPELPQVFADPDRVRRVLLSVLENALESMSGPGDHVLSVTYAPGPEGVVIRIADNGRGVAEHECDRIFDAFHTDKPGHAGLGLSVARGIVAAHGGRMWCESGDEGRGLVVALELPYEGPDTHLRFRPVPLTLTRTRSVLLVDDEDAVRDAIRRFLEKVGFEVREAWSGRSALAQLTSGRLPEAILTDLKMTDGSGYWFLDQLARDYPDLLRRTVVITGDTDYEETARLTRERGCPVMRKPLEPPKLLELLDEVAARA